MIYQWHVKATIAGVVCEGDVLATTEEKAKEEFDYEVMDWATGPTRFLSIEKTGMVLVHESEIKGR